MGKMRGEKEKIIELCRDKNSFLLLSHVNADGDAIGSLLALGLSLERAGKDVIMVNPDGVPALYRFLPEWERIRSRREQLTDTELAAIDLIITLDTATEQRLGDWSWVVDEVPAPVANIDHHLTNSGYGSANWIEKVGSTGEMVLILLSELGWEYGLDVALCLYTAIVTDTGSFRFDNTSSTTHLHASRLLQMGIEPSQVTEYIYESKPVAAVRLLGRALASLQLDLDGRVAWLTITNSDLAATGAAREDSEGIVNYARGIAGVDVGILFQETQDNGVKVSLRSGSQVDVSAIAQKFAGGGHRRAAGCRVQAPLSQVQRELLDVVAGALAGRDTGAGPAQYS
jgi:phosphoesterase RecJ-like protein